MKYQLFTYTRQAGATRTGIALNGRLFDLSGVMTAGSSNSHSFGSMETMLNNWADSHSQLKEIAKLLSEDNATFAAYSIEESEISFLPPLTQPGVIYAAGANYRDHVEAMGRAFNMKLVLDPRAEGVPPWHFLKAGRGTLAAHRQDVPFPEHTKQLDWEAELAVIIGKQASRVSPKEALRYVAGYSCSNDLSARDNLRRDQVDPSSPFRFDWIGHKCFTGACPLGPFITPGEFVDSPENLGIKLWLNGELKQDSNTVNHLYGVADQISYLSHRLDLYPGDIILTGTPAGVGMETGTFLKRGDVMRVWIEGLGELETAIV